MAGIAAFSDDLLAQPLIAPATELHDIPTSLFAPLADLLASGGDERLQIADGRALNIYGCAPRPLRGVHEFASSTATTISHQAYARAGEARLSLIDHAQQNGIEDAIAERFSTMRAELSNVLQLDGLNPDIVFAPSGTDASLFAGALVRQLTGGQVAQLIAHADETGSGVPLAVSGRHFSNRAALGATVVKGDSVTGLFTRAEPVRIMARQATGKALSPMEADDAVFAAVAIAVGRGERVLLHAMDCSKTGMQTPSMACLDEIASLWPENVQILIDACQMRLSRARLREYLARNILVTITGSKFFTGPAFSGALIVPRTIADRARSLRTFPPGLRNYATRHDVPEGWSGVRGMLSPEINFGAWLRWEAALAEMQRYFTLPASFRIAASRAIEHAIPDFLSRTTNVKLLDREQERSYRACDEGMDSRSIFPFTLEKSGRSLSPVDAGAVYRALNAKIETLAQGEAHRDAPYHLGQPVAVGPNGALRVSASARLIADAFVADDAPESERRLTHTITRMCDAIERTAQITQSI
jgi:hypothetical protein